MLNLFIYYTLNCFESQYLSALSPECAGHARTVTYPWIGSKSFYIWVKAMLEYGVFYHCAIPFSNGLDWGL